MSQKYSYLKQFLPPHPEFDGTSRNRFTPVKKEELDKNNEKAKELGFEFPSEMLLFYQEIGCGFLSAPHDVQDGYKANEVNLFLHPELAVGLYKSDTNVSFKDEGETYIEVEGYYMPLETYELLQPGDLPFFEVSNGQFLVMRPNSENPNAVFTDKGDKVENSFEKFVWRLYYESPTFYDAVYEAACEKTQEENN